MNPYTPFIDTRYNLTFVAFQLSEILKWGLGFSVRDKSFVEPEIVNGVSVLEATDNPFMLDKEGNRQYYQRPLVWDLEDKQRLIDAIYNYTDIGKFVIARNSYEYLSRMIKNGQTEGLAFHELIDGKQRLNTIVEFIQGKFRDSNGMLFDDMDIVAKRQFWGYNKCTMALLEDPTPDRIKRAFLNVNHTGKPMTKEHIEFIKSINV